MLKYYVKGSEALKKLHADTNGVVSFEYVLVAACIVTAVVFAFGLDTSGAIATKLSSSISAILAKIVIS
jgi:pilus assembly protein Flp/PilA